MSRVVVAIPVKNEAAHLRACLDALARQSAPPAHVLLLLNNCTDASAAIARAAADAGQKLALREIELPAPLASAGEARRLALEEAAHLAGPSGVILTTDADCTPGPCWVARNLREMSRGADVVCGAARIIPEPGHSVSGGLHFDMAREAHYAELLDEIAALTDPDPADPWPRHQQHSGASIAMTAAILHAAGGPPHVASGEDRALIERFRLVDARIRHAPEIEVAVSGRLQGRADGGMAQTLHRRAHRLDEAADSDLEPAVDAYRRVLARARLRRARLDPRQAAALARDLLIQPEDMMQALSARHFGAAWASVQARSPVLRRRTVRFVDLARETRQAVALRDLAARDCLKVEHG